MASSTTPRALNQLVRDGLSSLVFAFGYQTGIVDAFINVRQPCTAEELSQKAGKKLRYIQEWLGCLVAAGIVTINEEGKYSLPFETNQLKLWGHISTVIPILSQIFPQLQNAVSHEGPEGFWYSEPFLSWINTSHSQEDLDQWIKQFFAPVLKLKPGDKFTILDFGCGYGRHTRAMAKQYPDSKIYAFDMDQVSIYYANKELSKDGPKNIEYLCKRGGQLPDDWSEKFDFIIINDVLHDSFEVDAILEEIKRVIKPDGFAVAFDPAVSSYHRNLINDKEAQLHLPFSLFTCLPTSSINSSKEGLGIGWGYERRKQKIEDHGFRVVQVGDKDIDTIQEGIVFQKL